MIFFSLLQVCTLQTILIVRIYSVFTIEFDVSTYHWFFQFFLNPKYSINYTLFYNDQFLLLNALTTAISSLYYNF